MASSCVPATEWEDAGATLGPTEVRALLCRPHVLGLAEVMDIPGVLGVAPDVLEKIQAAIRARTAVDRHAPALAGRELIAFAAAGIRSDHESTTVEEARAKAGLGMLVQVREGSSAHNLDALLPLLASGELDESWCLVTDDIFPNDLRRHGHLDSLLRRVVAGGVDPAVAVRHGLYVPARHYGGTDTPGRAGLFGRARFAQRDHRGHQSTRHAGLRPVAGRGRRRLRRRRGRGRAGHDVNAERQATTAQGLHGRHAQQHAGDTVVLAGIGHGVQVRADRKHGQPRSKAVVTTDQVPRLIDADLHPSGFHPAGQLSVQAAHRLGKEGTSDLALLLRKRGHQIAPPERLERQVRQFALHAVSLSSAHDPRISRLRPPGNNSQLGTPGHDRDRA